MWTHLSSTLEVASYACRWYTRRDSSPLAALCQTNKSIHTSLRLCPSLCAYNDTCTADWCLTGTLLPAVVIFEASALPNSRQRYPSTPTELRAINVAIGVCVCVCVNCQFAARFLCECTAPACPLTELIFPFTLCEGHLQREGRERQEGTDQREGETERIAKERGSF